MQGSVGTCVNYGRIFIDFFAANLLQSVMVKEFCKSVNISRSYRQKLSGTFFPDTVYIHKNRDESALEIAMDFIGHFPISRLFPLHSKLTGDTTPHVISQLSN